MLKRIIVSQRVDIIEDRSERRDALDQKWYEFCNAAGLSLIHAPNNQQLLHEILSGVEIDGVLLTGGNGSAEYGGDAPERDVTDKALIDFALKMNLPLLGVCRGCQSIALYHGAKLTKISNHVAVRHKLTGSIKREVNSYHQYAVADLPNGFDLLASSDGGAIEALSCKKLLGIMWHPEREIPFCNDDIAIFKKHFEV